MSANQPRPAGPVVRIAGVDKTFARRDQVVTKALEGIDLDIAPGEFVSLIGPSGCGKSTLLRIIADLIEPSSGSVQVNGKPARQARLDQDYGIAFQQAGLLDWRTVAGNVELPLELHGVDRSKRRARAAELLDLVGLADGRDGTEEAVLLAQRVVPLGPGDPDRHDPGDPPRPR